MAGKRLQVGLGNRSYPIIIGNNTFLTLDREIIQVGFPKKIAIITNHTIAGLYLSPLLYCLADTGFLPGVITIGDGEQHKNLSTLEHIFAELIRGGYDRSSGLIALGGGVVGDITGFAAATYLRGVPFVQVPTTLLAQVDSSVGGKTAVNHPLGKNLIGAFYQPRLVQIDISTLKTLPPREFSAGLAEVVKYGMIRDRDFFQWLVDHREEVVNQDPEALGTMVMKSCQIKADVVEIDEKESSLRAILNFGHTFGHAVETLSGYGTVRHGEAVAIGMVVAAAVSCELGLCDRQDLIDLRQLLVLFNLPVDPPTFPLREVLEVMARDKKVKNGVLQMVLNRGIGDCVIKDISDPEPLLAGALKRLAAF